MEKSDLKREERNEASSGGGEIFAAGFQICVRLCFEILQSDSIPLDRMPLGKSMFRIFDKEEKRENSRLEPSLPTPQLLEQWISAVAESHLYLSELDLMWLVFISVSSYFCTK